MWYVTWNSAINHNYTQIYTSDSLRVMEVVGLLCDRILKVEGENMKSQILVKRRHRLVEH